jgi:hypothetical protein
MLIYSELATPAERVDLEPAAALQEATGKVMYHVWERVDGHSLPALFAKPLPVREYRGMVAAADLVWLLFPTRGE